MLPKLFAPVILSALLMGCSAESNVETYRGEFASMSSCVETLKGQAGPLKILKDTPEEVLGRTAADEIFACSRKETGTRGTYYSGWYDVRK